MRRLGQGCSAQHRGGTQKLGSEQTMAKRFEREGEEGRCQEGREGGRRCSGQPHNRDWPTGGGSSAGGTYRLHAHDGLLHLGDVCDMVLIGLELPLLYPFIDAYHQLPGDVGAVIHAYEEQEGEARRWRRGASEVGASTTLMLLKGAWILPCPCFQAFKGCLPTHIKLKTSSLARHQQSCNTAPVSSHLLLFHNQKLPGLTPHLHIPAFVSQARRLCLCCPLILRIFVYPAPSHQDSSLKMFRLVPLSGPPSPPVESRVPVINC